MIVAGPSEGGPGMAKQTEPSTRTGAVGGEREIGEGDDKGVYLADV